MLINTFETLFHHWHADPKVVLQYAGAKGRVHFIQISCTGNEANLLECRNEESGYSGPGSWFGRDFGVSCGEFVNLLQV